MSLTIQVLGKGLIPRGYGLAPRKEPFKADLTLIQTILATSGLKVNYLRPEDNKLVSLDRSNLKRVWDRYHNPNKIIKTPAVASVNKPANPETVNTKPAVEESAPVAVVTDVATDTGKADESTQESTDDAVFKPVNNPEDKGNNYKNNNYNKNHNKHK